MRRNDRARWQGSYGSDESAALWLGRYVSDAMRRSFGRVGNELWGESYIGERGAAEGECGGPLSYSKKVFALLKLALTKGVERM